MQSGQADIAYTLAEQQRMLIERMPNMQLAEGPTLYIFQLYLNSARGALQDERVRQAMMMAIDRDAYVLATQAGVGEPAHMFLPKAHWAYSEAAAEHSQFNLERAKELMKEAGHEGGLELDFVGYNDQANVQRQEVALAQLAKIGIKGRFRTGTIADISGRFFGPEKNGDVMLSAWTGRPDPSLTYSLLYAPDSYYNAGRTPPPEGYMEALAASRATNDREERAAALSKVQELAMKRALGIPLSVRYEVDALGKNVTGFEANLLGKPKFRNTGLE